MRDARFLRLRFRTFMVRLLDSNWSKVALGLINCVRRHCVAIFPTKRAPRGGGRSGQIRWVLTCGGGDGSQRNDGGRVNAMEVFVRN